MTRNKETFRITERKLRSIIKEGLQQAMNETSYDLARRAYQKSLDSAYDKKTFKPIPGNVERSERLFTHLKNKAPQNVDANMDVIVVGGPDEGLYKVKDLADKFEITGYKEPSQNPIYNNSPLVGMPILKGFVGPMLDGDRIRYETQEAYDFFSR